MKDKLKKLFDSNTEKHEAHYTSDGVMFFDKQQAVAHSKSEHFTGPHREVKSITRAEANKEETDADRLETMEKRMRQLLEITKPYADEYEELAAQRKALLEKLGKSVADDESDMEREIREAVEAKEKEEADLKAIADADAQAKKEADEAAQAAADAQAKEAEAKAKAHAEGKTKITKK